MLFSMNRLAQVCEIQVGQLISSAAAHHKIDPIVITASRIREAFKSSQFDWPDPVEIDRLGREQTYVEMDAGIDTWLQWSRLIEHRALTSIPPQLSADEESRYQVTQQEVYEAWEATMDYIVDHIDDMMKVDLRGACYLHGHEDTLISVGSYIDQSERRLMLARTLRDSAIRRAVDDGTPVTTAGKWSGVHRNYVHRITRKSP